MTKTAGIYGCHHHTWFSEDSTCNPTALCQEAVRQGLLGIAITDHFDTEFLDRRDQQFHIRQSLAETCRLRAEFAGRIRIFTGVEVGTAILRPHAIQELLAEESFDVVIGSVHTVRYPGYIYPFSRIDFAPFTQEQIHAFLEQYFADVMETVQTTDFDVLAHLTVPLRYIVGKYRKSVQMERYRPQIEDILQETIRKGCALEVNTSGVVGEFGQFMPQRDIVQKYLEMGGRCITLASDSHVAASAAAGLAEGAAMLRELGISQACFYEKRQPILYDLPG